MRLVFFLSALWLFYVYGGYGIALMLVSRWRRVQLKSSDTTLPSVSVLVAARNEAADIGWKVQETLDWDYPPELLEILVASDASEDATDEIVRGFDPSRVSVVRMERRGGKGRALNELAKVAKGEILFFTDANTHIKPHTVRLMTQHFADPRVACVTGHTEHIHGETPVLTDGAGAYEGYESKLKSLESSLGSVLTCDGAIFCMRSSLYHPVSPELANDLELPMRAAAAGHLVLIEPAALAYEQDTSSAREEFNRRRRMTAQGFLAMFRIPGAFGGLRGWQFVSHKLMRWLLLVPMIGALIASAALVGSSLLLTAAFVLQLMFYVLAGTGLVQTMAERPVKRIFAAPFFLLLGVVASFVGVIECLGGKRFDVWEVPTLSRGPVKVSVAGE